MPRRTRPAVPTATPLMQAPQIASETGHSQRNGRTVRRERDRELSRRIQALPQELQDIILDYTISFQPAEDNIVRITSDYKPPLGLQVSWHTRAMFAKAYYSEFIFQAEFSEYSHSYGAAFWPLDWLEKLVMSERDLIHTIRLENPGHIPTASTIAMQQLRADGLGDDFRRMCRWHPSPQGHKFDLRTDVLVMRLPDGQWYRCRPITPQPWSVGRNGLALADIQQQPGEPFSESPSQRLERQAAQDSVASHRVELRKRFKERADMRRGAMLIPSELDLSPRVLSTSRMSLAQDWDEISGQLRQ